MNGDGWGATPHHGGGPGAIESEPGAYRSRSATDLAAIRKPLKTAVNLHTFTEGKDFYPNRRIIPPAPLKRLYLQRYRL